MKVRLTAGQTSLKSARQKQKIQSICTLHNHHVNAIKRCVLNRMTQLLLTGDNFLLSLPSPVSASIIDQLADCLSDKLGRYLLRTLSLPGESQEIIAIVSAHSEHIVESITALQSSRKLPLKLLLYRVLNVERDEQQILSVDVKSTSGLHELIMLVKIETTNTSLRTTITHRIKAILEWSAQWEENRPELQDKLANVIGLDEFADYQPLLAWFKQGAFKLLEAMELTPDSDLAPLFSHFCPVDKDPEEEQLFLEHLRHVLARSTPFVMDYLPAGCSFMSPSSLVYVGLRSENKAGGWIEHAFWGELDANELNSLTCKVPFLAQKFTLAMKQAGIEEYSYEFNQFKDIFNVFPVIESFLLQQPQLYLLIESLKTYICRSESVKSLVLASPNADRISLLIIIPNQLYRQDIEREVERKLSSFLNCRIKKSSHTQVCGRFIGLHMMLQPSDQVVDIDVDRLDRELNKVIRPWQASFRQLVERTFGAREGAVLWQKYQTVFPLSYQMLMPPRFAVKDMMSIETCVKTGGQAVNLLSPCHARRDYRLHFYSRQEHYLDEYIPVLKHLGLRVKDQVQFVFHIEETPVFIKSFTILAAKTQIESFSKLKFRLLEAINAISLGRADNDSLNSLLVLTGMSWQQIDVLRAYRNYFLQLGHPTTMASFNHALTHHPLVTKNLFAYFDARFNPELDGDDPLAREEQTLFPLKLQLLENMAAVTDANDDKVLRTLFNLIDATVRCNFHVRQHSDDFFVAFKINSLGIIDLPAPKPQNEIYVHAATMEGIHLRGGKISRGGIRWSDRPDDFRTEILGLMQTQMSKNALIIPKGAKGGFIVKSTSNGEDFKAAVKQAYVTLMEGLLDLTDNYIGEEAVTLPGIVRYDDVDPYLVVAADKGTAQFSDLANSVSLRYRFWLSDAFASGGSSGYNHKSLGITARGAWECVKRHFREINKDIQNEPFSVVGVGSMDGDVFGNGMLQSRQIRLLAAISGQHIFVDPDPVNLEQAYAERQRLFELPGSSWNDYNRDLISDGGGVFSRQAKDIPISPQLRKWLGIRYKTLDGASLIRFLLSAPVELLWLGGIGTYVKATSEKNEDAGDRNNDEVRIDAAQLKAHVVGEGANLGFTQKARIEYALAGGRINTDAIDNSAGVDTSDHEVNLKILLTGLQKKQVIKDYQQEFEALTDEVCKSVLADNYRQSLCLSLERLRIHFHSADVFLSLAARLEGSGYLDRLVEAFPLNKEVMARTDQAITRPELAVLMAAGKMMLTQEIMDESAYIALPLFDTYLQSYFPDPIVRNYADYLSGHPLAQAIKATVISNKIINQAGISFLNWHNDRCPLIQSVTAYLTFEQVLETDNLREQIYQLDNRVSAEDQYSLLLKLENALAQLSQWSLINNQNVLPDKTLIESYQISLQAYLQKLSESGQCDTEIAQFVQGGIPESLAQRCVAMSYLNDFPLIVYLMNQTKGDFETVYRVLNESMTLLEIDKLMQRLDAMILQDYWERKAAGDLRVELRQMLVQLAQKSLESSHTSPAKLLNDVVYKNNYNRYQRVFKEVCQTSSNSLLPLLSLSKALRSLVMPVL
ncbi:NAD-glutamate dehydrogenase [Methylicorpusculum oleiharenae]|uniref:NAD-glutamate dehydrogenase domain-containing protein n=1 Tax=Methylicorpusculum oleiharenae TaxID=1338687 RepID=UPI001E2DC265|nr:NAD-glutamate dehydrogenase domain-containing protein [Methylicorpusculum oleiharenae]MCD2452516.1 NAD-glutamate dehydrogenase [Methylicorpusculum oleiharenae]